LAADQLPQIHQEAIRGNEAARHVLPGELSFPVDQEVVAIRHRNGKVVPDGAVPRYDFQAGVAQKVIPGSHLVLELAL
jgi:hypothetical protein